MNNLPAFLQIDSTFCDILRMAVNPDHEFGEAPGEYSVIAESIVCALDRSLSIGKQFGGSGRDMDISGETDHEIFKLFLLATQDIMSGDKVWVGTTEYKVIDVVTFPSHREAMLRLWK